MKRNVLIFVIMLCFVLASILHATENNKIIFVKIKEKTLELVENGQTVKKYHARIGKKSTPTPVGEGYIFEKRSPAIFRYQNPPNKGKIIRYSKLSNGRIVKIDYKKTKRWDFESMDTKQINTAFILSLTRQLSTKLFPADA